VPFTPAEFELFARLSSRMTHLGNILKAVQRSVVDPRARTTKRTDEIFYTFHRLAEVSELVSRELFAAGFPAAAAYRISAIICGSAC
jgi:hypothetical protein